MISECYNWHMSCERSNYEMEEGSLIVEDSVRISEQLMLKKL